MSEKEMRAYVGHRLLCDLSLRQLPYCTCGLDKVLSEPPDVVVILRKVLERVTIFKGNIKAAKTNEDKAYWRGVVDGYDEVKPYLERHIRLTADGWKWVDED